MTEVVQAYKAALVHQLRAELAAEVDTTENLDGAIQAILMQVPVTEEGQPGLSVRAVIAETRRTEPWWFTKAAKAPATTTTAPRFESAFEAIKAGQAHEGAMQTDAAVKQALSSPNPWRAGSENMTRQCVLLRHRPDEAARLMREAGK